MVNTIRGLGQDVNEQEVVQKVLRSLPIRFNPIVSIIEENKHLENMTMDGLWGILIDYGMRIEDPMQKEDAFKVSQKR